LANNWLTGPMCAADTRVSVVLVASRKGRQILCTDCGEQIDVMNRGTALEFWGLKFLQIIFKNAAEGSRSFKLPDFHEIRHMKVVRSSAPRNGHL